MTDRQAKRQKERIGAILEDILSAMGLAGNWEVGAEYVNEACECEDDDPEGAWATTFQCYVKWEYRQIRLRVYLESLSQLTDADVQAHIVHELVHALVNEMQEWRHADGRYQPSVDAAAKHEERVVVGLTQAILRMALMAQSGEFKVLQGDEKFEEGD